MEFILTAEQEQFCDSVRRLVESVPLVPTGATAASYAVAWKQFAELGVASLCLTEARGGLSGEPEDIALIAVELGRAPTTTIRLEPVVSALAMLSASSEPRAQAYIDAIAIAGRQPAAPMFGDASAGLTLVDRGDVLVLSGEIRALVGAATADILVAPASFGGAGRHAIVAVDLKVHAPARTSYRLADSTPVADLRFGESFIARDCLVLEEGDAALASAEDLARIILCASAIGGMERAIVQTIEYLKMRRQFGRALAEFQVLQHRVADMFMLMNDARSSLYRAIAATRLPAAQRSQAVAGCCVKTREAARSVTGEAVHLHGGIGFTTEHGVGHLFRRSVVDGGMLGGRDEQLIARLAIARAPSDVAGDVDFKCVA